LYDHKGAPLLSWPRWLDNFGGFGLLTGLDVLLQAGISIFSAWLNIFW
jgi:hypothetical protein